MLARRSGAPMWTVSRGDSTLILVGSIRSIPRDVTWRPEALEALYREHLEQERVGCLDEERAVALFADAWAKDGLVGLHEFGEGVAMLRDFVRAQGVVAHRDVLAVEHEFRLPVGRFTVLGFIDRVDRVDDETIEIVDYKTNRQLFTRDEVDTSLQLTLYEAAARQPAEWVGVSHPHFRVRYDSMLGEASPDYATTVLRFLGEARKSVEGRLGGSPEVGKIQPIEVPVGDGLLKVVSMGFLVEDEELSSMDRDAHRTLVKAVDEIHRRVRYGCKSDLLGLVALRGVGRSRARQMVDLLGVSNAADVAILTERDMQKLSDLRGWSPQLVDGVVATAGRAIRQGSR